MMSKLLDQYEQKDNLAQQLEGITKMEVRHSFCGRSCLCKRLYMVFYRHIMPGSRPWHAVALNIGCFYGALQCLGPLGMLAHIDKIR
jgi:hypothetical protein